MTCRWNHNDTTKVSRSLNQHNYSMPVNEIERLKNFMKTNNLQHGDLAEEPVPVDLPYQKPY